MKTCHASMTFLLLLAQLASAETTQTLPVTECLDPEADASSVTINFNGKAGDLLSELIRVRRLDIVNPELVGDGLMKIELPCMPLQSLMNLLAEFSEIQVTREGASRFRLDKVRNLAEINTLRREADTARDSDRARLIQTLQSLVLLSQPGRSGEVQASVEVEYHELGNLAMEDKDYGAAEKWYRARVADLDRSGAARDTNYGIALSNIADALMFQDKLEDASTIYESALVIFEKQTDLAAPSNAVVILETLSNAALFDQRFDEAEALAERAWKLLGDPGRSEWEGLTYALNIAADAESELGRLGPKDRANLHNERALELLAARYSAEGKELVEVRQDVMLYAASNGLLDQTAVLAERQLAEADQRDDRSSEYYVVALYQLLALNAEQGKLENVIELWPRLVDARRILLGDNSPNVVSALRQLATLYRLNGEWALADAIDLRAAAIKPLDDSSAIDNFEPLVSYAMKYDPALPMFCAKFAWTPTDRGYPYIPPIAQPVSLGVLFMPVSSPRPLPAGELAQARYIEQTAECFSDSPTFAGIAMEHALRLRIAANNANSSGAHQAAERGSFFFNKAGDAEGAKRVRALSGRE